MRAVKTVVVVMVIRHGVSERERIRLVGGSGCGEF